MKPVYIFIAMILGGVLIVGGLLLTQLREVPIAYSSEVSNCDMTAMGEFLTAYKDIRKNCTPTTNISNYTFFKYKPNP